MRARETDPRDPNTRPSRKNRTERGNRDLTNQAPLGSVMLNQLPELSFMTASTP